MTGALPVCVVIPAYNRAGTIARAVRSAQAQLPMPPARIVVVDDGSTDATADIARSLGAHVVESAQNGGPGAARNVGLQIAEEQWVAFLDSDDEWLPHHLATVLAFSDGRVLVTAPGVMTAVPHDGPRLTGNADGRTVEFRTPADAIEPESRVATSGTLVDRALAVEVGGFPAGRHSEDLGLWVALLERGEGIGLAEPTFRYHRHNDHASHDGDLMRSGALAVLENHRGQSWCTPELIRRVQVRQAWDQSRLAWREGRRSVAVRRARDWAFNAADRRALGAMLAFRRQARRLGRLHRTD